LSLSERSISSFGRTMVRDSLVIVHAGPPRRGGGGILPRGGPPAQKGPSKQRGPLKFFDTRLPN
jgi:hypothetical protein